jgi:hypothetical protein
MKLNYVTGKRILVLCVLLMIAIAAWMPRFDAPAMEQVDAGMKRALITFASARALNAAISLAQGTEVTLGVGAGVTLSVGEILDPVNDLVESFSNFMLMATVAFGVQKILLVMGQYEYVKVLLVMVLLGWGAVYFSGKSPPRWLQNLLIVMLMVRFAIPVVTVGSDLVFERFLAESYHADQHAMDNAAVSIKQFSPEKSEVIDGKNGWVDQLKSSVTSLDPRPHLKALNERADAAVSHTVNLMVIFLLQTLLVPLGLLWIMYAVFRSFISRPALP